MTVLIFLDLIEVPLLLRLRCSRVLQRTVENLPAFSFRTLCKLATLERTGWTPAGSQAGCQVDSSIVRLAVVLPKAEATDGTDWWDRRV